MPGALVARWPLFNGPSQQQVELRFLGVRAFEAPELSEVVRFHRIAMTTLMQSSPEPLDFVFSERGAPLPFLCALCTPDEQLDVASMRGVGGNSLFSVPRHQWCGSLLSRRALAGSKLAKDRGLWLVTCVRDDLRPASAFPDRAKAPTFADYHCAISGLDVTKPEQPLVRVVRHPRWAWHAFCPSHGAAHTRRPDHEVLLLPELCDRLALPVQACDAVQLLPVCIARTNQLFLAARLHRELFGPLPDEALVLSEPPQNALSHLLAALTTAKCQDVGSLERLETMGDSFLKFAVSTTLHAVANGPRDSEGKLTARRSRLVRNSTLFRLAEKRGLQRYLQSQRFGPTEFLPPSFGERLSEMLGRALLLETRSLLFPSEQLRADVLSSHC